jgi:hypothetical protein
MKLIIATFVACAFAAQDTTPPVISLNLEGMDTVAYKSVQNKGHAQAISSNAFARKCQAGIDTSTTCPSPHSFAFDHNEGDLSTSINTNCNRFVVSAPDTVPVKSTTSKCTMTGSGGQAILANSEYATRGEDVIVYSVSDSSGNAAEELVFAMIKTDTTSPTVSPMTGGSTINSEACMTPGPVTSRCETPLPLVSFTDNIDSKPSSITAGGTACPTTATAGYCPGESLASATAGSVSKTYVAQDWADIFGTNNANNVGQLTITVVTVDTKPANTQVKPLAGPKVTVDDANVCGAELTITKKTGETAITACRRYNRESVIFSTDTACAGAKSGTTYSAGSNACEPANIVGETVECNQDATKVITANAAYSAGKMLATGTYCTDNAESHNAQTGLNDDSLSGSIGTTVDLNVGAVGTTTYTYTCSAAGGSTTATRAVKVQDTQQPQLLTAHLNLHQTTACTAGSAGCKCDASGNNCRKQYTATDATTGVGIRANAPTAGSLAAHQDGDSKTTNPLLGLTKIQWSAGFTNDLNTLDALTQRNTGYSCTDECNTAPTATATWHKCTGTTPCCEQFASAAPTGPATPLSVMAEGRWAIWYTCDDGETAAVTACRDLDIVDHTKPIISILDDNELTKEASKTENYVDAGADCFDQIDGNIADKVEVSGDVVNLARVGTYKICYDCTDSAGNSADQACRTVTVEDSTCPVCTFKRNQDITLEAGFAYADQARFACTANDSTDYDMECKDQLLENCLDAELTMYDATQGAPSDASKVTLAELNAKNTRTDQAALGVTSHTGKYYFVYRTVDETGNMNDGSNCQNGQTNSADYTRTITVDDTIRPVIKLAYGNNYFKKSAAQASSAANKALQTIPTADAESAAMTEKSHAYKLMAEQATQSSVNGWVLGAIASAVSGLALLGYSLRKQTQPVATSVPV